MTKLHNKEGYSVPLCCSLLGYSKQAYYKRGIVLQKSILQEDMILRKVVEIRKQQPVIGGRKLHHLLQAQLPEELRIGRDAFFSLLRESGLLIRKTKSKHPRTTLSWHHFHLYPNLIRDVVPDGPNQIWVADITYIRKKDGRFFYLSLVTDLYSHKIVGWNLSESLAMEGALSALDMALEGLPRDASLIHHSDRGIQYCSYVYTARLKSRGIRISMTQSGDPKENAVAERVNGILKQEWINREQMVSCEQAEKRMEQIIHIYNTLRPHMSIDWLTPQQAHIKKGKIERRWKIYHKKSEAAR